MMIICGFAAVFGHIWTIFAKFSGGKGVATACGMMLGLFPLATGIALTLFCFVNFHYKIYVSSVNRCHSFCSDHINHFEIHDT